MDKENNINETTFVFSGEYYKPYIGGVENSFFYMSKAVQKKGGKPIIFVSDKDLNKKKRLPQIDCDNAILVRRFRNINLPWVLFLFKPLMLVFCSYFGLRGLKRELDDNVIIIARNHCLALAARMANFKQVCYLIPSFIKGLDDQKSLDTPFKTKLKMLILQNSTMLLGHFLQKRAIKKVHYNLVFSRNMEMQLKVLMGNSKYSTPIKVPAGVDIDKFYYNHQDRKIFRNQFGVTGKNVFLCLGRIVETKGYSDVLKAFSLLPSSIKEKSKIVIIGNGVNLSILKKLSSKLELDNYVLFTGASYEPQRLYCIGDCFMMTSRYEAFGQTILEAMASELPVIAYRPDGVKIQTAIAELIVNEKNGFICEFSIEKLSETMQKFIELPESRRYLIGKNNRNQIKTKYSWEKLMQIIYQLFN